jgi:hypothetical protein
MISSVSSFSRKKPRGNRSTLILTFRSQCFFFRITTIRSRQLGRWHHNHEQVQLCIFSQRQISHVLSALANFWPKVTSHSTEIIMSTDKTDCTSALDKFYMRSPLVVGFGESPTVLKILGLRRKFRIILPTEQP